jgi:WD40 repeat protein
MCAAFCLVFCSLASVLAEIQQPPLAEGPEYLPKGALFRLGTGESFVGIMERIFFLPNAEIVTTKGVGRFQVWDAETGKQKRKFDGPARERLVRGAAFSVEGTRLATSGMDDAVKFWDFNTGRLIYQLPGHGAAGTVNREVHLTPDGRFLLSWSPNDYYVRKWDLRNGESLVEHRLKATGVDWPDHEARKKGGNGALEFSKAASSDGKFTRLGDQFIMASTEGNLHYFDIASGEETRFVKIGIPPGYSGTLQVDLWISPTGKHVVLQTRGRFVHICGWNSGNVLVSHYFPGETWGGATFSPDGRTVAIVAGRKFMLIELASLQTRLEFELPVKANLLQYSPDGSRIAAALEDGTAVVWDVAGLAREQASGKGE